MLRTKVCYFDVEKTKVRSRCYYDSCSRLHSPSDDEPSTIIYHENGNPKHIQYDCNGTLHRNNGKPAQIGFDINGYVRYKRYFKNGKYHRENGKAAHIDYYPSQSNNGKGIKEYEEYYQNGKLFRENNQPIIIEYYPSGGIKQVEFNEEGDKPNKIKYSEDGNLITEIWISEDGTETKRNVIDLNLEFTKPCRD